MVKEDPASPIAVDELSRGFCCGGPDDAVDATEGAVLDAGMGGGPEKLGGGWCTSGRRNCLGPPPLLGFGGEGRCSLT